MPQAIPHQLVAVLPPRRERRTGALTVRSLALMLAMLAGMPQARAADDIACSAAIAKAERKQAVPNRVLGAIGIVESGRAVGRRIVPWPWSINVAGIGYHFDSKGDAIAAVEAFRAQGTQSIDVGCMQINLKAHPQAFDSLENAFDPAANANYAAHFLHKLYQQSGKLAWAMTSYHSQTPDRAADYARRLLAVWPGAASLGLTAEPALAEAPPVAPASHVKLDQGELAGIKQARAHPHPAPHAPTRESLVAYASSRGAAWPQSSR